MSDEPNPANGAKRLRWSSELPSSYLSLGRAQPDYLVTPKAYVWLQ
jgi:hypothetical protein